MTSRKNINIFDFNGVNVAKHWHVAGRGICHLWLPCFNLRSIQVDNHRMSGVDPRGGGHRGHRTPPPWQIFRGHKPFVTHPPPLYLRYLCWLAKLSDVDNKSPSKISTRYSEIVFLSTTLVYNNRYLFTKRSSQHRLFSKRAQFILVDLASQNLISHLLGNLKTKSLYLYD